MSFVTINQASIYYEEFGEDHPGKVPILLIHGSTITGQLDWGLVAPLLARNWKVIVPDCRGHGKSANPNMTYSFRELANDAATLVHALGYEKVHVVGHSNGGNVALVLLMEHPEVVQTAVLQAANAYVSQDLIEKEPNLFDPQRVARERPGWMNEMIALHGPTHGPDYWKDLLRLTVQEIITEPNYTGQELQAVGRPTLVIQGEKDGVNAPAKHAQFIAQYIQDPELWLPEGIGHNVHQEILFEWIAKLEDFLFRRGDEVNDALFRIKRLRFADLRVTVFDLHAHQEPEFPARIIISGKTLSEDQRQLVIEKIRPLVSSDNEIDSIHVKPLLENAPWALVNRSVTDLRKQPHSLAERVSQGLLGESIRLLEEGEAWSFIRMERDGYLGWIHKASYIPMTINRVREYQAGCSVLVKADLLPAWLEFDPANSNEGTRQAGKLPFGIILPLEIKGENFSQVRLPDGRLWWVASEDLMPLNERPLPSQDGILSSLELFRKFIGVPYLWGGRSPFGFDCSGFAGTFYSFLGLEIPRDADMQFQAGAPVEGDFLPGDLLFFGHRGEGQIDERQQGRFERITHVAISLGGQEVIHANSAAWGVSINSLDPASSLYRHQLKTTFAGTRRFIWN